MFDGDGTLRLIDYNCARAASGAALSAGVATGALLTRAPELKRLKVENLRNANTPASDMWAAGLILYEMSAGRLAYCNDMDPGTLRGNWAARVAAGNAPEDMGDLERSMHPTAFFVMKSCLQKDPSVRITAQDAYAALATGRFAKNRDSRVSKLSAFLLERVLHLRPPLCSLVCNARVVVRFKCLVFACLLYL